MIWSTKNKPFRDCSLWYPGCYAIGWAIEGCPGKRILDNPHLYSVAFFFRSFFRFFFACFFVCFSFSGDLMTGTFENVTRGKKRKKATNKQKKRQEKPKERKHGLFILLWFCFFFFWLCFCFCIFFAFCFDFSFKLFWSVFFCFFLI